MLIYLKIWWTVNHAWKRGEGVKGFGGKARRKKPT
jgi:hypothetical protein